MIQVKPVDFLKRFINPRQLKFTLSLCKGEEGQFFIDKLAELQALITGMPKTYDQNGKGDNAIVYLHYFKNGADWFVTEKDMEEKQLQAFGLADIFRDGGELGYISIEELLKNNVELDYHWTPKTLGEVRKNRD